MPLHPWQSNFTTGEISDLLDGQTAWNKYAAAAKCLGNFVVRPQGGVARRAGSVYLGEVKDSTKTVRLVRFEFNVEQAYVLEWGHLYVRVWANRAAVLAGGVQVELVTPYPEAELMALRFEQSADVMWVAHINHPPMRFQRLSATTFELIEVDFNPAPTTLLTDVAAPITGPLTVTGSRLAGGTATATGTAGTIDFTYLSAVLAEFGSAPIRFLEDIPQSITALDAGANSFTVYLNGDLPLPEDGIQYTTTPPAYIPDGTFAYETATGTYTFPAGSVRIEEYVWNAADGYPGVVALFQQRLWFAGSAGFPDRVWGSAVADYENFATGVRDDEAVEYQLAFSGVNMIRWMKALPAGLAIGTSAGELTLEGGNDNPLTPTNVRARERTFYGSDATLDAVRTVNVILFVQRGALRVREFTYTYEQDTYVAPDLTILAEHLTRAGVIDFTRSVSPDSLLFVVTGDGGLAVCTYERAEQIVGWSHHGTGGRYERICVIPNACGTGDEVWTVVNRTIEGVTRRYLEVFDGRLNVDSGLAYEGVAAGTFTGMDHLEGQAIKAIAADGTVFDLTVTDGGFTLPDGLATTKLEAGLHYTSTLMTVRPEFATGQGSAQAMRKHWDHATVRVFCTASALVFNGETVLERPEGFPETGEYTGDLARQTNFGWSREGQLVIQTLEPKTVTILGITGAIEVENP